MYRRDKPMATVVATGHHGAGTSSLMGQLLYTCGAIDRRTIEKFTREAKPGQQFAWVMNRFQEERDKEQTIYFHPWRLDTRILQLSLFDTPGNPAFIKNFLKVAAFGHALVLVVSADPKLDWADHKAKHWKEAKEKALLSFASGIKQVIVAVNQMDRVSEKETQQRFEEIRSHLYPMLNSVGFKADPRIENKSGKLFGDERNANFVPVATFSASNIIEKPYSWHKHTLLDLLDALTPTIADIDKPLRVAIVDSFWIGGIGTVATGFMVGGSLQPGDTVIVQPDHTGEFKPRKGIRGTYSDWESNKDPSSRCELRSLERFHEMYPNTKDEKLDFVGLNLGRPSIPFHIVGRGKVIGKPYERPPLEAIELLAQIGTVDKAIHPGYAPLLFCGTGRSPCEIVEVLARLDGRSLAVLETRPKILNKGQVGLVRIKLKTALVVEEFREFDRLGRIILRDHDVTVGVGAVRAVSRRMERDFKSTIIADNVQEFETHINLNPDSLLAADTEGNNILHLCFIHRSMGTLKRTMQLLLDENTSIRSQPKEGEPKFGLIFAGNQKNHDGWTPFHTALLAGAAEECATFLEHGIEFTLPSQRMKKAVRLQRPLSLALFCLATLQNNKDRYTNLDEVLPPEEFHKMLLAAVASLVKIFQEQHEKEKEKEKEKEQQKEKL